MAERLTLRIEPGTTSRDKIEAAVTKLGYGIGATKAKSAMAFVIPAAPNARLDLDKERLDRSDHAGDDHEDRDHGQSPDTKAKETTVALGCEDALSFLS